MNSNVSIGEIHIYINLVIGFRSPANVNVDKNYSFSFSSIPQYEDGCHNNSSGNIKSKLTNWAISERVTKNCVDKLLKISKIHHLCFPFCYQSLTTRL